MIYEEIYKRIDELVGGIENIQNELVLTSKGFMDLHVEKLTEDTISLTHYYKVNEDLVPDPDMEVIIHSKQKIAEALSYQDAYRYDRVYYPDNKVDLKAKRSLNSFLLQWLKNLKAQGFGKTTKEVYDQD